MCVKNEVYHSNWWLFFSVLQVLLPAASLLQLMDVRQNCCDFLQSQLHPTNCLGIRAFADVHTCTELLQQANAYAGDHSSKIQRHQCLRESFVLRHKQRMKEEGKLNSLMKLRVIERTETLRMCDALKLIACFNCNNMQVWLLFVCVYRTIVLYSKSRVSQLWWLERWVNKWTRQIWNFKNKQNPQGF